MRSKKRSSDLFIVEHGGQRCAVERISRGKGRETVHRGKREGSGRQSFENEEEKEGLPVLAMSRRKTVKKKGEAFSEVRDRTPEELVQHEEREVSRGNNEKRDARREETSSPKKKLERQ